MAFSVSDKVCLVTGGAAGVGAGIVKSLLSDNARHVAFLDIAEREGAALEKDLYNKFGGLRAKFIKCDISDEEQLTTAYYQVLDKYRRLDVVVNNAGVLNTDESLYRKVVDVNFTATVGSTYKALNIMGVDKGGYGGVILNVSSLLALKNKSHLPLYAATKTAVLQFSTSMGSEQYYKKTKVRVLTVCLGPTDTAILHRHNLDNFEDCSRCLPSHLSERQRVESAVTGIIEVINRGESGSTWIIAEDKAAMNVTSNIREGLEHITRNVEDYLFELA